MESISLIFSLLVFFQLKHFIADYILQGKYMIGKFKPGWDFLLPLLAHVGVHGIFTLGIILLVAPHLWWLCLVDISIHFVIDRIKAGPKYLGRYKPLFGKEFIEAHRIVNEPKYTGRTLKLMQNEARRKLKDNLYFWIALGFDQMIHHLTDLYVVYVLVMDKLLS